MKLEFSWQVSKNTHMSLLHKNPSSGSRVVVPCRRRDGRTRRR